MQEVELTLLEKVFIEKWFFRTTHLISSRRNTPINCKKFSLLGKHLFLGNDKSEVFFINTRDLVGILGQYRCKPFPWKWPGRFCIHIKFVCIISRVRFSHYLQTATMNTSFEYRFAVRRSAKIPSKFQGAVSLRIKWSRLLKISSVNVNKTAVHFY